VVIAPRADTANREKSHTTPAGTRHAEREPMRAAVACLLLSACVGARPAVIPKLSELPGDPEKRAAVLDQSHAQPGPEQRPVSKKARKVETYAATAAAVVGWLFSTTENVALGGAGIFEEVPSRPRPERKADDDDEASPTQPVETGDAVLVPWIRLK
jgi:hypothetical protein